MTLDLTSLPAPKFRYAPAVEAAGMVRTAGMVGLDPVSGVLAEGGAGEEFKQILANLGAFISANGFSRRDVFAANIFVTDFATFGAINQMWDDFFDDDAALPARTSVGVSALPIGATVEADFMLARRALATPSGA